MMIGMLVKLELGGGLGKRFEVQKMRGPLLSGLRPQGPQGGLIGAERNAEHFWWAGGWARYYDYLICE